MVNKGKMLWIPAYVLDELEDLIREENITGSNQRCKAWIKLTQYTRVGRELNRLRHLNFSNKMQPPPRIYRFKQAVKGLRKGKWDKDTQEIQDAKC